MEDNDEQLCSRSAPASYLIHAEGTFGARRAGHAASLFRAVLQRGVLLFQAENGNEGLDALLIARCNRSFQSYAKAILRRPITRALGGGGGGGGGDPAVTTGGERRPRSP